MRQAFAILPSAGQSVTHRLKGLGKGLEYGVKGQEGISYPVEYGEKGQEGISYPVSPKGQDDVEKPARLKDTKGSAEKADAKVLGHSWGQCLGWKGGAFLNHKATGERH